MKTNVKAKDYRVGDTQLAGDFGLFAAKQDPEGLLRRAVLTNLLWERLAYESGEAAAENIKALIPQVKPKTVYDIAVEARTKQKLRHVPLFIAREMARLPRHKALVSHLLRKIVLRPDELTEFLALYWADGKQPLSKQVKIGLGYAFGKFDAYQLAKYNRGDKIKLRDVMFLVHPRPPQGKEELFKQLADDTLTPPDTWEVALSVGQDKKAAWTRLINERRLGALAFVRNLRNMEQARVEPSVILKGFETINPRWLLPLNYLAAAKATPKYERELEALMLRGLSQAPKLSGHTVFVVDTSGSMDVAISSKSQFNRMHAAAAMAMLAAEMCERISVYVTAGSDGARIHQTEYIKPRRGFALSDEILSSKIRLGGGGIFTRQCLEFIKEQERVTPDRIMVFSDSQDCDYPDRRVPAPFGVYNYIIDVSSHARGINYGGLWTAEISGWSEHFLAFVVALEGTSEKQQGWR